jgi:hypothetical protein
MLKKLAIIIVFVLVVASVAGCTSKGVEITAHQSEMTSMSKYGGYVSSVKVNITNHGPGYFDPGEDITFYRNGTKVTPNYIAYPVKDNVAISVVGPGETFEFEFGSFSSYPDTLRYNDGMSDKTVAVQKS